MDTPYLAFASLSSVAALHDGVSLQRSKAATRPRQKRPVVLAGAQPERHAQDPLRPQPLAAAHRCHDVLSIAIAADGRHVHLVFGSPGIIAPVIGRPESACRPDGHVERMAAGADWSEFFAAIGEDNDEAQMATRVLTRKRELTAGHKRAGLHHRALDGPVISVRAARFETISAAHRN